MSSAEGSSSTLPTFAAPRHDSAGTLAAATVGLVSKEEFTKKREEIEAAEREVEANEGKKEKKKKKKKAATSTLSFGDEEAEEDGQAEEFVPKKAKLGKNPMVDTSMLYDADRAAAEQQRKDELAREWKEEQDKIKAEKLVVDYSYHDPGRKDGLAGHRHTANITKGYTIAGFLDKCREQVKDLRGCAADQLIYVKEDLILPHSLTFYELITKRARGKSGPLFQFDVHEDIRMGPTDHRVEKDESHPGKVMLRHVYERLKDKFPYSRFEVYDESKKYDTYTIHGGETFGEGNDTAMGAFGVVRKG